MRVYLLLCSCLLAIALSAQPTPNETLTAIFAGMRAGDSTGMRAYFHPEATLHSVVANPDGTTRVSTGSITGWFKGMQGAPAGALDEQLYYSEVRTDGDLATAWTPYLFVYKEAAHHCGTNAFQLVRDGEDGRWRILHITDTRSMNASNCTPISKTSPEEAIINLADSWHRAAAEADSTAYFDAMAADAIFIGTDKTEHWTKEEFLAFAAPYFAKGKAWAFTTAERHVFYDPNQEVAYWDELLDTWMGPCRGTGVAKRDGVNGWKIAHYTLSVTVPNDKIDGFIELTKE